MASARTKTQVRHSDVVSTAGGSIVSVTTSARAAAAAGRSA
jgi:hypothetical protein